MGLSPTAILDAMLHMELPRHERGNPFAYYPLYHEARQAQQQISITAQSPITAFEAMLDAELMWTIHKARARSQQQHSALYLCFRCQTYNRQPYSCIRCQEYDRGQVSPQRMPGAWSSEDETVQIVSRRPSRPCISEIERARSVPQHTPSCHTQRGRENRWSRGRERQQRHQMLAEELDEQIDEWLRNTRAQRRMMEEMEAAGPSIRAHAQAVSLSQHPPAPHACTEERAVRRSDEHYIGWVDTPNLSPIESECSSGAWVTVDRRVAKKSDECYIGWADRMGDGRTTRGRNFCGGDLFLIMMTRISVSWDSRLQRIRFHYSAWVLQRLTTSSSPDDRRRLDICIRK